MYTSRDKLLFKVGITKEAEFDYEECLDFGKLPKADIKMLVEEYLYIKRADGKTCKPYFTLKYLDEECNTMLLLFIKQGKIFAWMQGWQIVGVCRVDDYDEDYESHGKNKVWYESPVDITGLPKTDWVKELGARKLNIQACKIIGIRKEIENAIQYGGYKEIT